MVSVQVLLLTFLIIESSIEFIWADPEIKLLHVLFRHGEKVPHKEFQNYPNDPYANYTYNSIDSGDLTNVGKLREYTIGKTLRERYGKFFGSNYQPSQIDAQSTNTPRTQMSLQLVLAGLFPPSKEQTWNPHLNWLPVSTYSVLYQDHLFFPFRCSKYTKLSKEFLESNDAQNIIAKYKDEFNYLTQQSGKKITIHEIPFLYYLFVEQKALNLTLPEWTKKIFPYPMKNMTIMNYNLMSYTSQLKRFNGGMLLFEIIRNIDNLRNGTLQPSNRKAFFYSAHEFNVAAMTKALNLKSLLMSEYGSTIILETLQDKDKRYYMRIVYWTGVTEKLIIERLPGCDELCPIEKFVELLKDVIPNVQEFDECRNELQCSHRCNKNTGISHGLNNLLLLAFISIISLGGKLHYD